MIKRHGISAVILAAGASTRLGFPKQLIKYKAKSLILRKIDLLHQLNIKDVYVVLGAHHLRIRNHLKTSKNIKIILNKNWSSGLSSSLRCILNLRKKSNDLILLMLVDQVLLNRFDIEKLISTSQKNNSNQAATKYPDGLGTPAIVNYAFKKYLKGQRGDTGAKIIFSNIQSIRSVELKNALFDIDTKKDLARLTS